MSHMTGARFGDIVGASDLTKRAIADVMKYVYMTQVQKESIPIVMTGKDVFVKAKTGTGKTLAFLIPAIDVLISEKRAYAAQGLTPATSARPMVLVLSPTRELAQQIAKEAQALCTYHHFSVTTLVGGTNMRPDVRALLNPQGCDIVVATPGRMLAHMQETPGVPQICSGVKVLVLDEADRLLDMVSE